MVAPHAGAWIETIPCCLHISRSCVAPHAGAWIETIPDPHDVLADVVAPHAGAWIETCVFKPACQAQVCRTPRGCVD